MPVAIGRRIDQNQELLLTRAGCRILFAILSADIHGRLARHAVACKNVVELGYVIAGEEYVVTQQREAFYFSHHAPCHR